MKAHKIIERVQRQQRFRYGIKNPRTLIIITPTYVRTFQTLHLTGLMHSLMNVPYDLMWIVVEAGGTTNETASLLTKSRLSTMHIGFEEKMPVLWEDRHRMEAQMRIHGLSVVREEKLDGIVMFADDSNMHSMALSDEIQKVQGIGAVSIGILAHPGNSDEQLSAVQNKGEEIKSILPIQGPSCNSSDQLVGWHTFVKNFQTVFFGGEDVDSLLSLLKDPSVVEPLGSCGRKVMLWWLHVEARADGKFPAR